MWHVKKSKHHRYDIMIEDERRKMDEANRRSHQGRDAQGRPVRKTQQIFY